MRLISKIAKGMLKIIFLLVLIMFFIIVYRYYFYPKFILTYSINEEIGQVIRQNNLTSLQNFTLYTTKTNILYNILIFIA